jgi:hypothetical protein
MLLSGTMKVFLFALLFSLSAFAQDSRGSTWVRSQWNDKLTGDLVVAFRLSPQADDSGRQPYIGITCDPAGRVFTYVYFTDDAVHIDAQYSNVSSMFYPTEVRYRADANKVKADAVTVRPDFRTINIDQRILYALTGGHRSRSAFHPIAATW